MTDVFVGRIFFGKVSEKVVAGLVNTTVSANNCTAFSFILAAVASLFFLFGQWEYLLGGVILLYVSELFDFVDGDLARAKGNQSKYGALFDSTSDTIKKPMLIFSIAFGAFFLTQNFLILPIAFFAMVNLYFVDTSRPLIENIVGKPSAAIPVKGNLVFGMLDTLVIIILFGALINQIFWVIVLITVLLTLVSAKRLIEIYKIMKKERRK